MDHFPRGQVTDAPCWWDLALAYSQECFLVHVFTWQKDHLFFIFVISSLLVVLIISINFKVQTPNTLTVALNCGPQMVMRTLWGLINSRVYLLSWVARFWSRHSSDPFKTAGSESLAVEWVCWSRPFLHRGLWLGSNGFYGRLPVASEWGPVGSAQWPQGLGGDSERNLPSSILALYHLADGTRGVRLFYLSCFQGDFTPERFRGA